MIGPSSSHTAGAVRIGAIARKLLGAKPVRAEIYFYESFSKTYWGHGTDKAIIGGLLGMSTDDPNLKDSLKIAKAEGFEYHFNIMDEKSEHPNAALIKAEGSGGEKVSVLGFSVGGGNVLIRRFNNIDVEFTGQRNTLIVPHKDRPGTIYAVTKIFADQDINIESMKAYQSKHRGESIMIIETDQVIGEKLKNEVKALSSVLDAIIVPAM